MTYLVVINMYIAVILENFSQATEDVQQGLTQDDFDMYYEVWERFDEKATEYIDLDKLSEFVDTLEEPLRIPQPNYYKLVSLDIPICENERVHCVDILEALTRNFLGTTVETNDVGDFKKGPSMASYIVVSSTLKRQREIVCCRIIQRRWRNIVRQRQRRLTNGDNSNNCGGGGGDGEHNDGGTSGDATLIDFGDTDLVEAGDAAPPANSSSKSALTDTGGSSSSGKGQGDAVNKKEGDKGDVDFDSPVELHSFSGSVA